MTIYQCGYTGKTYDFFVNSIQHYNAKLVDCRFMPYSRNKLWDMHELSRYFGNDYRWIRELGNKGYKTGTVAICDLDHGIDSLDDFAGDKNVILFCVCTDTTKCHTSIVAGAIQHRFDCDVIDLNKPINTEIQPELF